MAVWPNCFIWGAVFRLLALVALVGVCPPCWCFYQQITLFAFWLVKTLTTAECDLIKRTVTVFHYGSLIFFSANHIQGLLYDYSLLVSPRNFSRAATIEGVLGAGAFIESFSPASSTAFEVVWPNAPIKVPFCYILDHCGIKYLH